MLGAKDLNLSSNYFHGEILPITVKSKWRPKRLRSQKLV